MVDPRLEEESRPASVIVPPPSRASMGIALIALLIAAAALLGLLWSLKVNIALESKVRTLEGAQVAIDRDRTRLGDSVERLSNAVTNLSDQEVDLMNPRLQNLRYGFAVSQLAIARQESGVLVRGVVINGSSLFYRAATFRVKAGTSTGEFTISNLSPGAGGAFQVVLPNIPLENARTASFRLGESNVELAR
jgi:hypothetical protein